VTDIRKELKLSQALVMTPQLQMAIKLLSTPARELDAFVARSIGEHAGALVALGDGEPDPLEAQGDEEIADGVPPFTFVVEDPFPSLGADVWVFGNPPQARANRAVLPRLRVDRSATPDAMRAAAWVLRSLRQRARTYEKVVQTIVDRRPQLAIALEPEKVDAVATRDIADAVGMHESTIQRVAAACTFQTLHGLRGFAGKAKLKFRAIS
jgi:hypothetical protein